MRKKWHLALISALFLTSCVDYNSLPEPIEQIPVENYSLKMNSSTVAVNDTIYGSTVSEILFFVTDKTTDQIVAIQIDFGDGSIDGGTQVLHRYKNAGIYKFKATVVGTNAILERIAKISAPSVSTAETIVQLSGNSVGDSAAINLLCLKSKIYSHKVKGKYFLKGDMTNWKTAIEATDTAFIYNGAEYLLFNFKVKNYAWSSFGYYKAGYDLSEHWGYDPDSKYWDKEKGLYKIYVSGAKIYPNQLTASTPGAVGDPSNSANGPCIRLDYESNGTSNDSLVIYANRNYLSTTDSTKLGISYTVDGGATVVKKASFLKNTKYIFVKVPVTKSSSLRFKTLKDISALTVGDMTSSIFYNAGTSDCYLTIAGTMQKIKGVAINNGTGLIIITAGGERLKL